MTPLPVLALVALGAALVARPAPEAARAGDLYRAKCSSCHDAGMANAPRLGIAADWTARLPRGRTALHEAALRGVPDSAMAAKGGYRELSDAEVRAIVDYMIAALPADVRSPAVPVPASTATAMLPAPAHADVVQSVIAALRAVPQLPAQSIKVRLDEGSVILEGVLDTGAQIRLAEQAATRAVGGRRIVSKLIASDLFEWD